MEAAKLYKMPNREEVARVALSRSVDLLRQILPGGKLEGCEYGVKNPTRYDERLGSFKINTSTGRWSDFATGDSGRDLISLYSYVKQITIGQAIRELADLLGVKYRPGGREKQITKKSKKGVKDHWVPVLPIPGTAPPAPEAHPRLGKPCMGWVYLDSNGKPLGYVARFKTKEGKETRPLTFCLNTETGKREWRWKSWPIPRPLYGLNSLADKPEAPVLVVEGEKTADKAQEIFPTHVVITAPHGSKSAKKADWGPLKRRKLVIFPDSDEPGIRYAQDVAMMTREAGAVEIRIVEVPPEFPRGWDLADDPPEGWNFDRLRALVEYATPFSPDILIEKSSLEERKDLDNNSNDNPNNGPNEDEIALAFAEIHKDDLRYCHHTGAWFHYNGALWVKEETKLAFSWARDICREMNQQNAYKISKASTAAAVERYAQADRRLAVTSEIWDRDLYRLGTPMGSVDLRTGKAHSPVRDYYLTKQTIVAPADEIVCPHWKSFLNETTRGDKDLQRFLQQVAGYCLTGDTSEHALFFVYGPGGNGKSVFLNTLTKILGNYATVAAMDTFTASKNDRHPTDLAMLKGARLVSASETEQGKAWAESRIKQITGGDKISARFMRQDFFEYQPQFKLVIIGNHKPILHNVDDATRRRFNIIAFIHKPENPDKQLEKKLEAEYPSILRWTIDGCLDWQKNGLIRPSIVTEATQEYFNDQDLFGRWIEDCCQIGSGKFESAALLFGSWKSFAEKNGEQAGSSKSFGENMTKRNFFSKPTRISGDVCRAYHGISLKIKEESWKPYSD